MRFVSTESPLLMFLQKTVRVRFSFSAVLPTQNAWFSICIISSLKYKKTSFKNHFLKPCILSIQNHHNVAFAKKEWGHVFHFQQFYRHRMHGFQYASSQASKRKKQASKSSFWNHAFCINRITINVAFAKKSEPRFSLFSNSTYTECMVFNMHYLRPCILCPQNTNFSCLETDTIHLDP